MKYTDVLKRIEKIDVLVKDIKDTYKLFLTLNLHEAFNHQNDTLSKVNALENYLLNTIDIIGDHAKEVTNDTKR